jgi:hypothetical protein
MIPKSLLKTLSALIRGPASVGSADEVPADAKELLSEIAELAGISPSEEVFHDIWAGIELANTIHAIQHGGIRARRKSMRELTRLGKVGSNYAKTLKECSAHTAFLLSIVRPHFHPLVMPDLARLANVIAEISTATRDAIDAQDVGRQNLALKQLVLALLDAVERAGGDLRLDEVGTGTLISALAKLREAKLGRRRVLSRGLIPKTVPWSLQTTTEEWAKTAKKNGLQIRHGVPVPR